MKRFFVLALFAMLVLFSFPLAAFDEPLAVRTPRGNERD